HKRGKSQNIEFELEVEVDEVDKARIETVAPTKKESYKKYLKGNLLRIKKILTHKAGKFEVTNLTFNYDNDSYEDVAYATLGLHTVFQACLPKPI
ncbi:ATP-dependent endonuclease, partial [Pantoea agglomerans]